MPAKKEMPPMAKKKKGAPGMPKTATPAGMPGKPGAMPAKGGTPAKGAAAKKMPPGAKKPPFGKKPMPKKK